MQRLRALLAGLGAGATAMYFFDPARGKARREACRQTASRWAQDVAHSVAVLEEQVAGRPAGAPCGGVRAPREGASRAAADQAAASAAEGTAAPSEPLQESWPPAAEAALKLGGYALLARLALGRAFWPAVIGSGGLYWAARRGLLEAAPDRVRDVSRSLGSSLSGRLRAMPPGGLERPVAEIMSTDVAWCTADAPLCEAARLMRDHDCGSIPVVDDGLMRRPIGVITDRDIAVRAVAEGRNPSEVMVRDCMSAPAATAHCSTSLDELVRTMEEAKLRRMVIVDDDGRICGIVAQADLARELPRSEVGEVVREVSELQAAGAG
jgi:CBS domain-containing protein